MSPMNKRVLTMVGTAMALATFACGPSAPPSSPSASPASAPPLASAPPPAPEPSVTSASATPVAAASAIPAAPASATPAASASAPAAPIAEVKTAGVTAVSNEISTPAVVTPDRVIATLRPKFNACFADGLKKDPKTGGSVTLSAKIEKDGKVSAVTPKMLTGFSPVVVKCLSDHLKTANFAAAGGMNYATSLDIPLTFTSNP